MLALVPLYSQERLMLRGTLGERHLHALTALLAVLGSGCLGHLYEVPRSELERLVQVPPEERGHSVYAVQQFSTADEPAPAPAWQAPEGEPPPGYSMGFYGHWVPTYYVDYGAPICVPRAPVAPVDNVHGASPIGAPAPADGDIDVPSINSPRDGGVLLAAVIVAGVAIGVGLVASEGARFEGEVAVHPQHPVHLMHYGGGQSTVPLNELTPEQLQDSSRAVLNAYEGAGLWLREAAPLNRAGFSYQFGAGNDALALPGWTQRGAGFRFALGYYPLKQLGLLVDSRLMSGNDGFNSFNNVRLGAEAQWYPLALWRLHLGGFAGAGQSWYGSIGPSLPSTDGARPYFSFGGLAEFELTTRLGLTFRWTQDLMFPSPRVPPGFVSSWTVGLAVY
jgi:hypothetical protein